MNVRIEDSWRQVLQGQFDMPYFEILTAFVRKAYSTTLCYPPAGSIFRAFNECPFNHTKVVILGQDPYHEPGQAIGLAFAVPNNVQPPPSLQNIYKELQIEGFEQNLNGILTWPAQGVLLLNATLTVEAHKPGAHQNKGWEELTDAAIIALNQQRQHIVFMLWGAYAQRKERLIDQRKHLVLKAPHPSPLSAYRGFFGCNHFIQANNYLLKQNITPIKW